MFGGLDPTKVIMILLLGAIIVGPERLPRAARQLGATWRELTRLRTKLEDEVRAAMPDIDLPRIPNLSPRGITGYVTGMMAGATSAGSAAGGAGTAAEASGDLEVEAEASSGVAFAAPALGSSSGGDEGILGSRGRPGSFPGAEWQSTVPDGVPAGWSTGGASSPGYMSGSNLPAVPSLVTSSPIAVETLINFDEPSWN